MQVKYTNDYDETAVVTLPLTWHFQKNFTLKELANNKASESVKFISTPRSRKFLALVQKFRDWYGPVNVTSNYRTRSYNQRVGGAYTSLHLDGLALDFRAEDTDERRAEVRAKWREITRSAGEIGGINYYSHGYHICIGEEKFGNKGFVTRDYRQKRGDW